MNQPMPLADHRLQARQLGDLQAHVSETPVFIALQARRLFQSRTAFPVSGSSRSVPLLRRHPFGVILQ